MIGEEVTVTVMEVAGQTVRLGIDAPKGLPVYREEIWLAVKAENIASAESDGGVLDSADGGASGGAAEPSQPGLGGGDGIDSAAGVGAAEGSGVDRFGAVADGAVADGIAADRAGAVDGSGAAAAPARRDDAA